MQLIHDVDILSAHADLDMKNAARQLIDLRNETHRNQVLLQKQHNGVSNLRPFDEACYEALVHPGMISHPDPKVNRTQSTH